MYSIQYDNYNYRIECYTIIILRTQAHTMSSWSNWDLWSSSDDEVTPLIAACLLKEVAETERPVEPPESLRVTRGAQQTLR